MLTKLHGLFHSKAFRKEMPSHRSLNTEQNFKMSARDTAAGGGGAESWLYSPDGHTQMGTRGNTDPTEQGLGAENLA
jgi:hypothetical protein